MSRGGERLVALSLLAVVLFSPWLLRIFGGGAGGGAAWPPLYLYLFGSWGAVILLLALQIERRARRRRGIQAPGTQDAA